MSAAIDENCSDEADEFRPPNRVSLHSALAWVLTGDAGLSAILRSTRPHMPMDHYIRIFEAQADRAISRRLVDVHEAWTKIADGIAKRAIFATGIPAERAADDPNDFEFIGSREDLDPCQILNFQYFDEAGGFIGLSSPERHARYWGRVELDNSHFLSVFVETAGATHEIENKTKAALAIEGLKGAFPPHGKIPTGSKKISRHVYFDDALKWLRAKNKIGVDATISEAVFKNAKRIIDRG